MADGHDDAAIAERPHLLALGFRMLGTVSDAEDAVQETYTRWFGMTEAERADVVSPRGWLTRTASRVCLDMLGSARARRERYVGEWLPEPVPAFAFPRASALADTASDPLDHAALDDSISTALLLVLETMTPAERVVFVLHDVFGMPFPEVAETVGRSPAACRQLASSARRRVEVERGRTATPAEHDRVVRAFAAAAAGGDLGALVAVLDPGVVLVSDGGGRVSAARRPVVGADNVARFLLGLAAKYPESTAELAPTGDGLAVLVRLGDRLDSVASVAVGDGVITGIRMVRNPDKLTQWS